MKTSQFLTAAALTGAVSAADTSGSNGNGPGPYPNASYFAEENRQPNSTRKIQFQPFFQQIGAQVVTWNWQVNITSVPSPSDPSSFITNTVYSLIWPTNNEPFNGTNNGTLNEVAANATRFDPQHFCVSAISGFTQNATDSWNPNAENGGGCIPPLGNDCYGALQDAWNITEPDSNGCRNVNPSQVTACRDKFDSYLSTSMNLIDNGTMSNDSSIYQTFPLHSGAGFYYEASAPHSAGDSSSFDQADTMMRMLLIDSGDTFRAMCTRVRYNETAEKDGGATKGLASRDFVPLANVWFAAAIALGGMAFFL